MSTFFIYAILFNYIYKFVEQNRTQTVLLTLF